MLVVVGTLVVVVVAFLLLLLVVSVVVTLLAAAGVRLLVVFMMGPSCFMDWIIIIIVAVAVVVIPPTLHFGRSRPHVCVCVCVCTVPSVLSNAVSLRTSGRLRDGRGKMIMPLELVRAGSSLHCTRLEFSQQRHQLSNGAPLHPVQHVTKHPSLSVTHFTYLLYPSHTVTVILDYFG
jgi:hypothetical protein